MMIKCHLCNGTGTSFFYLDAPRDPNNAYAPMTVKTQCSACNGTGELPREVVEQHLKLWAENTWRALMVLIGMDKSDLGIQEQNIALYFHMEIEKLAMKALDMGYPQRSPLLDAKVNCTACGKVDIIERMEHTTKTGWRCEECMDK